MSNSTVFALTFIGTILFVLGCMKIKELDDRNRCEKTCLWLNGGRSAVLDGSCFCREGGVYLMVVEEDPATPTSFKHEPKEGSLQL